MMIVFKDVWILFLIPLAVGVLWYGQRKKEKSRVRFSSVALLEGIRDSWKIRLRRLPEWLQMAALILLMAALAGPRKVTEETIVRTEGVDIVLTIDASGSMAAEDFVVNGKRRNRLDTVKSVVREFIEARTSDRIGLIAFAKFAYTVCPLTTDYNWLTKNLDRVDLGLIEDGTAVGSAIASSLNRLKGSEAKSRIVILLTDGVSNAGEIDPLAAAKAAQAMGIKIYTIGAGTKGFVPFPVTDFFGRRAYQRVQIDLDEETLREVADLTGGQYYRATDTESLRDIYHRIDALERSEIEVSGYKEYQELFPVFVLTALFFLLIEVVLSQTVLLRIP